ncbi:MAG: hypothetical protein ACXQTS_03185, partial [Candidatus Methanospirareceae archaeon]
FGKIIINMDEIQNLFQDFIEKRKRGWFSCMVCGREMEAGREVCEDCERIVREIIDLREGWRKGANKAWSKRKGKRIKRKLKTERSKNG